MKRRLLPVIAMSTAFLMLASIAQAQIKTTRNSDVELSIQLKEPAEKEEIEEEVDKMIKSEVVEMPQPEEQNITIDYLAPLGEGLMLLSCLGGAYLLDKRRKEE